MRTWRGLVVNFLALTHSFVSVSCYAHMRSCLHVRMCVCVRMSVYVCVCVCACTLAHVQTCRFAHVPLRRLLHIQVRTCSCACVSACVCRAPVLCHLCVLLSQSVGVFVCLPVFQCILACCRCVYEHGVARVQWSGHPSSVLASRTDGPAARRAISK